MRKKVYAFGLTLALMASMMMGCKKDSNKKDTTEEKKEKTTTEYVSETETEEVTTEYEMPLNYEEIYDDVIQATYNYIVSDDVEGTDEQIGIREIKTYHTTKETLEIVGYKIMDISGDGVPELIIGGIMEKNAPSPIYQIYTTDGEDTYFVVAGWDRSVLYLKNDYETMYSFGSSGAAYVMFGTAKLSEDGRQYLMNDFYCTLPDEETEEIRFYHNQSGEWESDKADLLDVTEDDFWKIDSELSDGISAIMLTPFIDLPGGSYEIPVATGNDLKFQYASEADVDLTDAELVEIDYSDYCVDVAVIPVDGSVTDIKICNIAYSTSEGDKNLFVEGFDYYKKDILGENEAFVVRLAFPGDMPTVGITFTTADGSVKRYALSQSGYDGSVVASEYYLDN